jgi:hypothetical protein
MELCETAPALPVARAPECKLRPHSGLIRISFNIKNT